MKNPTVLLLCLLLIGLGVFLVIRQGGGNTLPAPEMNSDYHAHGPSHSHGPGGHHHTGGAASLADLQARLSKTPEDVALRSRVIHQAISEKKPEIAIEQCYTILENDPENEYATSHLATSLLEQGDLDKAMHYAAKNLSRNPDAANTLVVAHVYFRRGELPQAAKMFQKALDLEPGNADAQEGLRRCR